MLWFFGIWVAFNVFLVGLGSTLATRGVFFGSTWLNYGGLWLDLGANLRGTSALEPMIADVFLLTYT